MYKIYEFYKEPCDDKSECLVADIKTEESAYKRMLACFTIRNDSGKKYYSFADNAVKCEHVNGHLKTSLPEKYMNREVYMAEAWVTFPRMDISISLQTKGFESWNMTGNKEGGTLK